MFVRFIQAFAFGCSYFVSTNVWYARYTPPFPYSTVDGYLNYLQFEAFMNNDAADFLGRSLVHK